MLTIISILFVSCVPKKQDYKRYDAKFDKIDINLEEQEIETQDSTIPYKQQKVILMQV
jgi:hypothetical protein